MADDTPESPKEILVEDDAVGFGFSITGPSAGSAYPKVQAALDELFAACEALQQDRGKAAMRHIATAGNMVATTYDIYGGVDHPPAWS